MGEELANCSGFAERLKGVARDLRKETRRQKQVLDRCNRQLEECEDMRVNMLVELHPGTLPGRYKRSLPGMPKQNITNKKALKLAQKKERKARKKNHGGRNVVDFHDNLFLQDQLPAIRACCQRNSEKR